MAGVKEKRLFRVGEIVKRLETGETGIVRGQYKDGYVVLEINGWPTELDPSSVEKIQAKRPA